MFTCDISGNEFLIAPRRESPVYDGIDENKQKYMFFGSRLIKFLPKLRKKIV